MIRVVLPFHLRALASITGEVKFDITSPVTTAAVLDAIETRFPMLRGTIRDQITHVRRPFVRFFVCQEDVSLDDPNKPLPESIVSGEEPFLVVGAIAGG